MDIINTIIAKIDSRFFPNIEVFIFVITDGIYYNNIKKKWNIYYIMKFIRSVQLISVASAIRPRLTNNKVLCRDCKHFIANDWECGKFGETNIITGKESFDTARSARSDEKKCGEKAIMFEENRIKFITVPYYWLKDYWPITISVGFCTVYFFMLYELIAR